jgi:hypothetical protein
MGTDGNAYSSYLMTFVNHVYVHLSGYPWVTVGGCRGAGVVFLFALGIFGLITNARRASTKDSVDMNLNGDNTANSRAMDCAIAPCRVNFPDQCMSKKTLRAVKSKGQGNI